MLSRVLYSASRLHESIFPSTIQTVIAHANSKLRNIPHFSTINKRLNRLEIKFNENVGNDNVIAIDSTGIKLANRGEWMPHKWHTRRAYLKIHVAVDIKNKKIISLKGDRIG